MPKLYNTRLEHYLSFEINKSDEVQCASVLKGILNNPSSFGVVNVCEGSLRQRDLEGMPIYSNKQFRVLGNAVDSSVNADMGYKFIREGSDLFTFIRVSGKERGTAC